jgi:hypothetical protein
MNQALHKKFVNNFAGDIAAFGEFHNISTKKNSDYIDSGKHHNYGMRYIVGTELGKRLGDLKSNNTLPDDYSFKGKKVYILEGFSYTLRQFKSVFKDRGVKRVMNPYEADFIIGNNKVVNSISGFYTKLDYDKLCYFKKDEQGKTFIYTSTVKSAVRPIFYRNDLREECIRKIEKDIGCRGLNNYDECYSRGYVISEEMLVLLFLTKSKKLPLINEVDFMRTEGTQIDPSSEETFDMIWGMMNSFDEIDHKLAFDLLGNANIDSLIEYPYLINELIRYKSSMLASCKYKAFKNVMARLKTYNITPHHPITYPDVLERCSIGEFKLSEWQFNRMMDGIDREYRRLMPTSVSHDITITRAENYKDFKTFTEKLCKK